MGRGASQQLIVHPHVGDGLHDVPSKRDLRRAKQLTEAGDGKLLGAGTRRDVDVGRHRLLEAVTRDDWNTDGEGKDERTFHRKGI